MLQFTPLHAQTTILSEGFEGAFPGAWSVGDGNGAGAPAYWKGVNATFGGEGAHTGAWKGYCAGTGFAGDSANPSYQNAMAAYLSRNIDLSGYLSATLTFWYKTPSIESCCDRARVVLSGIESVEIWSNATPTTAWTPVTINLTAYVGSPRTLIFQFESDASVTAEGWYLDDILVTGIVPPANDACSDALALQDDVPQTLNTVGATVDGRVPACQSNFGKDVWFTFTPTAADNVGVVSLVCTPPSGSTFAKGVTTVQCVAADAAGNTNSCSFTVSIRDVEAPTIRCPDDLVVECGTPWTFGTSRVSDNCDGIEVNLQVLGTVTNASCGLTFHAIRTWRATDSSGNSSQCSQTITVRDVTAPQITCPASLMLDTDPGQCSRSNVVFTVAATDDCAGVTLHCTPPSDSTFAKGVTTVNCMATDSTGNTNGCSFTVTIRDNEPPQLNCPSLLAADTCANSV